MNTTDPALELETLESRILLSGVEIFAAGGSGQENLSLQIDGVEVATFENIGGDASNRVFQQLVFETDQNISADQIRIEFTNDLFDAETGLDRNLFIDRIVVDGETFQTESPSVFTTGVFTDQGFSGPGFLTTETLNTNGSFFFSDDNTPRNPTNESQVTFVARGTTGDEIVQLEIDGQVVETFQLSQVNQQFQFKRDYPIDSGTTRLVFVNDLFDQANGIDRNVILDSLEFENLATNEIRFFDGYSPEIFSTGTFTDADGIVDGFGRGGTLHTNGFFAFPGDAGSTSNGTTITVDARGTTGDEVLQLLIDGQVAQEFNVTNTGGLASFQFTSDSVISADRIRIGFANDFFDAANNIDRNLIVETLTVANLQTGVSESFSTSSPTTFSTGSFTDADGIVSGFGRGNTLHSYGFFQFAGVGADSSVVTDSSGGFGLDPSFGSGGELAIDGGAFGASQLLSLPDGRFAITAVRDASTAGSNIDLVFFTADGQIDTARGDNGEVPFFDFSGTNAVFDFEDGSVLVVESSPRSFETAISRFDPNGTLVTSFGDGGTINLTSGASVPILAVTPDGGFVQVGDNGVERFDSNGQRDFSFGNSGGFDPGFTNRIEQLVVDDSGNIFVITDDFESPFTPDEPAQILRLTSSGQPDFSFGNSGLITVDSIDTEAVVDSQGRLIFAEEFENDLFQLSRVNVDGSLDPTFGFLALADSTPTGLQLEIDEFDRVVGFGSVTVDNGFDQGDTRFEFTQTIFRLNENGTFDTSFADGGSFVVESVGPTFGEGQIEDFRIADDGSLFVLEEFNIRRFTV